ncbi:MAG: hypothetical protein L0H41_15395 [Microlunatus sp.]|nr:hypothetical protein [Microlunatus sp.]
MSAAAAGSGGSAPESSRSGHHHHHDHASHDAVDLSWLAGALTTLYEPSTMDPDNVVEGLGAASCGPRVKDLASLGIGVAAGGGDADRWRSWVLERAGVEATPLLTEAEGCMRASGLWPWPG